MLIIQLIIIQVITFTALIFFLRKIMYSASLNETKRLERLSEENIKRARDLAAKIEEAEKQYQEKILLAEMEAKKLKAEALKEIELLKQESVRKARQESERILNQALSSKEKIKEDLEAQLNERSVARSLKLVSEVLSSKNQIAVHDGFVKDILEEIGKLEKETFRPAINSRQSSAELEIDVITPYELAPGRMDEIIRILSSKMDKKLTIKEVLDKEIIAGITIKLGSLVIDGSLAGRLRESAERMKKG